MKSHVGFRLVSTLMTLNDLEQCNDRRLELALLRPVSLFILNFAAVTSVLKF